MTRQLQKVGNSKCVVLTCTMLEHLGVSNEIEVSLEEGRIVLTAPERPASNHKSFEEAKNATFEQYGDALQRLADS